MSEFTCYVGEQIRRYRKAGNMTLQDLADAIHKSRATICKYENGEISVDVETLYEISQVLQVSISQLTTYLPESENEPVSIPGRGQKSPFFQAQRLYFYFYDGRSQRTKDGVIGRNRKIRGDPDNLYGFCQWKKQRDLLHRKSRLQRYADPFFLRQSV